MATGRAMVESRLGWTAISSVARDARPDGRMPATGVAYRLVARGPTRGKTVTASTSGILLAIALTTLSPGSVSAQALPWLASMDCFDRIVRGSAASSASDTCHAALRGDVGAMYRFGRMLMESDGVLRDEALALALLRKAEAGGSVAATLELARSYERGRGVRPDLQEALRRYRQSAIDDYPRGKSELAVFLERRRDAGSESFEQFRSASALASRKVAAGDLDALYVAGAMLITGEYSGGPRSDPGQGVDRLRRTAEKGHAPAALHLGLGLLELRRRQPDGKTQDPLPWLRQATAHGEPAACAALAHADPVHALGHYLCAATQGHVDAMYELAELYHGGGNALGVRSDLHQARYWYLRAFDVGHARAATPAARMAFGGLGGPRDEATGIAILRKMMDHCLTEAAELRNLAAMVADQPAPSRAALDLALTAVEKAMSARNPELWLDTLAWIHFRLGNTGRAEAILRAELARRGDPDNGDAVAYRRTLGDVLYGLGRMAEARTEWERALRPVAGYEAGQIIQRRLELTR